MSLVFLKKLQGSENELSECKDFVIEKCFYDEGSQRIIFIFENGVEAFFEDNGQDCCEKRYLTCSDDLSKMKGEKLMSIEIKNFQEKELYGEVHEINFLSIGTNKDSYSFECHVEHNGYYGSISPNFVIKNPDKVKN